MEPEAILHELTHAENLPEAALRAASVQRSEMVPLFLREVEEYLARARAAGRAAAIDGRQ